MACSSMSTNKIDLTKGVILFNRINGEAVPLYLLKLEDHATRINKVKTDAPNSTLLKKEYNNAYHTIKQLHNLAEQLEEINKKTPNQFSNSNSLYKVIENINSRINDFLGKINVRSIEDLLIKQLHKDQDVPDFKVAPEPLATNMHLLEVDSSHLDQLSDFKEIETNIADIKEIFAKCADLVHVQAESVDLADNHIIESQSHVQIAGKQLNYCASQKAKVFPLIGAAIGSVVAGPLGLLVGGKVGTVAAIGGACMGYFSGRQLKSAEAYNK